MTSLLCVEDDVISSSMFGLSHDLDRQAPPSRPPLPPPPPRSALYRHYGLSTPSGAESFSYPPSFVSSPLAEPLVSLTMMSSALTAPDITVCPSTPAHRVDADELLLPADSPVVSVLRSYGTASDAGDRGMGSSGSATIRSMDQPWNRGVPTKRHATSSCSSYSNRSSSASHNHAKSSMQQSSFQDARFLRRISGEMATRSPTPVALPSPQWTRSHDTPLRNARDDVLEALAQDPRRAIGSPCRVDGATVVVRPPASTSTAILHGGNNHYEAPPPAGYGERQQQRRRGHGWTTLLHPDETPAFLSPNAASPTDPPPASPTLGELVVRRMQSTSLAQFLWIVLLMIMLLVGNAFQVIFLNFWIHQFPEKESSAQGSGGMRSGNSVSVSSSSTSSGGGGGGSSNRDDDAGALASSYTTFVISATVFPAVFIVAFTVHWLWRRPNLRFMREGAGWWLLLGIGMADTLNSALSIYAAAQTPEVLQAIFVSLVPLYSAFFTKWLLRDPRNYANPHVAVSFLLIAAGVALASLFAALHHQPHHHHSVVECNPGDCGDGARRLRTLSMDGSNSVTAGVASDRRIWCFIFFLSVPPTVLMNVWQTMYMIRYTTNDALTAYLIQHAGSTENSREQTDSVHTPTSAAAADDDGEPDNTAQPPVSLLVPVRDGRGTPSHLQRDPAEAGTAAAPVTSATATAAVAVATGADAAASTRTLSLFPSDSSRNSNAPVYRPRRLHIPHNEVLLHGEDTTVKLVMLAADTAIQASLAFALMPMDALPWFGGSDSLREVIRNFDEGLDCVLHCPRNMRYCILYSMGFVLVYIAAAHLNRYSVTLCSMVSQLSGPITALLLIAFPSLNMTGDATPWYTSVFAVMLLTCGTVLYVYWDEMTIEEKAVGEMQLKWAMMQEQARRHAAALGWPGEEEEEDLSSAGVDHRGEGSLAVSPTSPPVPPSSSSHRSSRSRRHRLLRRSDYVIVMDRDSASEAGQHP